MRRFISFIVLVVILSCQDTKTSKKTSFKEAEKKTVNSQKDTLVVKEETYPKGTLQNPMIGSQAELKPFLTQYGIENPETKVRFETRFGNFEVELFKDTPLHRANFIMLVKNEYFNTTQFHRVSQGFVVQGGNNDTQTTAKNRARMGSYLLPNEAKSKYRHNRGAFSSAKYTEQNISKASAPFEFFIVQPQRGAHHLDGEHTVFGRVTKGMSVIDKINKLKVDGSEWPLENVYMRVVVLE
jgi:peptidylprolyl isomerase